MGKELETLTSRFTSWKNLANTTAVLERDKASVGSDCGCEGCSGCGVPYGSPEKKPSLQNQYECAGCGACGGCCCCSCEG